MNAIRREWQAKVYMYSVSAIGWFVVATNIWFIGIPEHVLLFLLLVLFLGFTEYYPLPVWKGNTSLSLPIIYSIDLVFGVPILIVSYAVVVLIVNTLQHRPFRILLFNPAQLLLSYLLAKVTTSNLLAYLSLELTSNQSYIIIDLAFLVFFFYLINNILVDIVLWLRPQAYPFGVWMNKWGSELFSATISFAYVLLMIFLGSQDRSQLDVFAAFFFFSPLVGFSLLTSSIGRLKKERNRLKAMFSFTNDLNQTLPSQQWQGSVSQHLQELLDIQGLMLLSKEQERWIVECKEGLVTAIDSKLAKIPPTTITEIDIIYNRRKKSGLLDDYFHKSIHSLIYLPLLLEKEFIGLLVVGRTRTHSFTEEDVRSTAILGNQLAVALKTRSLILEQKDKRVLEERNRIAREIHDGVAQTLAGAVMNLDTAQKKFSTSPSDSFTLIDRSLDGLRGALKEVRDSIYALRPKSTDRVTLEQAIRKRIDVIENEQPFTIRFEVRGKRVTLPSFIEKIMFDTFQESIQNTVKHSNATKVEVLISFQSKHVLLKITDNGKGFSLYDALLKAQHEPHFGLLNMNEEAESIEASLQIDTKLGEGTNITLTIPIEKIEGGDLDD